MPTESGETAGEAQSPGSEQDRLAAAMPVLKLRSSVLRAVRSFFVERGFMEVETPVRLPTPALELNIDALPSGDRYLRTSPELYMKRLLAAGYERIFQVGPCFRSGECGRLHNPEYTMLEWYRSNADYSDVLVDIKALVLAAARTVLGRDTMTFRGVEIDLAPAWEYRTVSDAFRQYTDWDPVKRFDADRFDVDMTEKVEPRLCGRIPVILADYPAEAAALARRKPGNAGVAERWELYIGGIELANAFSELTDPVEQRRRFEECARERASLGKEVYPLDEEFLAALGRMPPSAGVALGIDRLVMLFTGADSLDAVLPFRRPVG